MMVSPVVQFWMAWGLIFCPYVEMIEPLYKTNKEKNDKA